METTYENNYGIYERVEAPSNHAQCYGCAFKAADEDCNRVTCRNRNMGADYIFKLVKRKVNYTESQLRVIAHEACMLNRSTQHDKMISDRVFNEWIDNRLKGIK